MRTIMCIVAFGGMLSAASAQELDPVGKVAREWRIRGQFAGYQGLISVGGGPLLVKGHWRPALMYGFAPADAYRVAVHQVILRNDVMLLKARTEKRTTVVPTASLNLLLETGRHSYLRLPDRFPEGYYMAPLPRATVGAGARLARRSIGGSTFKELAFTAEVIALDTYLWYALSERGFSMWDAIGLSFGFEVVL